MLRGPLCLLVLGGMLTACPTWSLAQVAPRVPRPQRGSGVSNNLRWLQFRVVSGRIVTSSQLFGRQVSSSTKNNGREENLSINLANGIPNFRYELGTQDERVTISGTNADEMTVRREPRGDSIEPLVELEQPIRGRLTLTIQGKEDAQPRVVAGTTLWHMVLAEPEIMQQVLLPIVEVLQPDWKLGDLATKLEPALLQTVGQQRASGRKAWGALVAELTNDRFAARESADRKLRSVGAAVTPYLSSLDRRQLSAEQQIRIRRIIDSLNHDVADNSVERIADWMSWDPRTWIMLLDRPNETTRQTAASQLALLLEEPLEFDPLADEGIRREQLKRLRARFDPPAPAGVKPANPATE